MILVTGATGGNGAELAKLLASRGVPVRAIARSPGKAKETAALAGAEVVAGDFDGPASVERALQGVERAFLLTDSTERAEARQLGFVQAAQSAGLKHVVKLWQFAADERSSVRFLRYHAAVERAIRESGMAWTFLRPNLFMQGLLAFRASTASEGRFFAAAGGAEVSVADVRDNAAAAAAALSEPGHEGRTYDLTGPEALTHAEMAARLSDALGRPVAFLGVPPEAMRGALPGTGCRPGRPGAWSRTTPITGAARPPPSRRGCGTRRGRRRGSSPPSPGTTRRRFPDRAAVGSRPALRRGSIAAFSPEPRHGRAVQHGLPALPAPDAARPHRAL